MGHLPLYVSWASCHLAIVLRESKSFSHRFFVAPKLFLADISWVQKFLLWSVRGPNIFSRGYLAGPKFFSRGSFGCMKLFLVGISCVTCEFISDEYE